ncbi:hypothetical protein POM88_044287 [Heracleum sosnowskyi]|uniref:Uncharacterized protein n=1 Tax=Heracleum sosnowskyi TaxID=360622 RepID=A0AAD8H437_9APIA|nr:hypothetical protein POM88_044287 [Heracleum sosnowskyi]
MSYASKEVKYFVWRQSDAVIYKGWLANARRKYSEVVSIARGNWENHNRRDNRIGLDVYLSWVEFWKTDDFKKKSSIQKSNRCSGVDGRLSTHTSGSTSHRIVAARVKVQYKRDPTTDEIFYLTHTRRVKKKKNPIAESREIGLDDEDVDGDEDDENFEVVWVDQKSQRIYNSRECRKDKQLRTLSRALECRHTLSELECESPYLETRGMGSAFITFISSFQHRFWHETWVQHCEQR